MYSEGKGASAVLAFSTSLLISSWESFEMGGGDFGDLGASAGSGGVRAVDFGAVSRFGAAGLRGVGAVDFGGVSGSATFFDFEGLHSCFSNKLQSK